MPDLEERFRLLARTSAPDLWPDAVSREPRAMPIGASPRRRLAIAALAFVVAVAGVGLAVWAFRRGPEHRRTPVGPAIINGRIAYASNANLWTIEPDGTDARRLTSDLPGWAFQPSWSPDGTRLVFSIESHQDSQPASIDSFDLYEIGADGSGLTRLTTDGLDFQPSWSPDGTKIAYSHDGTGPQVGTQDIWVMNADGSDPVALTHERSQALALSPSWSPDGRKILFVSNRTGTPQIYVMNADGTDQTQLTEDRVFHANPQYSPEGTQIAFAGSDIDGPGIYVMNADGTGIEQLTQDAQDGPLTLSWAPDATKIVYTTSPQANQNIVMYVLDPATKALTQIGPKAGQVAGLAWQPVPVTTSSLGPLETTTPGPPTSASNGVIDFGCGYHICTMSPDGANITDLTKSDDPSVVLAAYDPVWSPDGTKIAFYGYPRGAVRGGANYDVYVMNADGSGVTNLTTSPADVASWFSQLDPKWSPDGTQIVYDGDDGLYVMNADGSGQTRVAAGQDASWSRDGTRIAFQGADGIATAAPDGTGFVQLTSGPGFDGSPAYSPDGSKIAYYHGQGSDQAIFVMNADGSNQMRVADFQANTMGRPVWSPDGSRLAFDLYYTDQTWDIYVVNADGSGLADLTDDQTRDENDPVWSPDGTTIAFQASYVVGGVDNTGTFDIYVMNPDGTDQIALTHDLGTSGGSDMHWQRLGTNPTGAPGSPDGSGR